jgi:hypothetical protein
MVLTPSGTDHAQYINASGTGVDITPGYDILWVAGIACGAFNFASTVTTDGTVTGTGTTIHTDTKDANLVFSAGDIIQEVDNTVIGQIKSIGTAATADVDIEVDRVAGGGAKDAIGDGVKIYHRNPITLILSFEK